MHNAPDREFRYTLADFRHVQEQVYELAGIKLGDCKQDLVYSRLSRRIRALGLADFRQYRAYVNDNSEQEISHLIHRESGEKAKLHYPGLTRVQGSEVLKGLVQPGKVDFSAWEWRDGFIKCHPVPIPSALGPAAPAGMVDENTTHRLCRYAQKVCSTLPIHMGLIHHFQVGFVNQRSGLKSVIGALSVEIIPCQ